MGGGGGVSLSLSFSLSFTFPSPCLPISFLLYLSGEIVPKQKVPGSGDKIRHSGMQPGRETTRSNVPRWRKLVRRPREIPILFCSSLEKRCPINLYVAVPPSRHQQPQNMGGMRAEFIGEYAATRTSLVRSFRFPIITGCTLKHRPA